MGIRIHKVLGYGINLINDKVADDWHDKVYDNSTTLLELCQEIEMRDSYQDYLKAVENKDYEAIDSNKDFFHYRGLNEYQNDNSIIEAKSRTLDHFVHINGGAEIIEYIVFSHPYHKNWSRYDDNIDYYEANHNGGEKVLDLFEQGFNGIYPYNVFRIRRSTELLDRELNNHERGLRQALHRLKDTDTSPEYIETFLNSPFETDSLPYERGYRSVRQLLNDFTCEIPSIIKEIVWKLGIFKDRKDIYELRPMVYTYWC